MINLKGFLKGEVAYIIDKQTEDTFLSEVEHLCNMRWLCGTKPTNYKDYWVLYNEGEDVVIGVVTKMDVRGMGHGYRDDFKNYKVEVFKC